MIFSSNQVVWFYRGNNENSPLSKALILKRNSEYFQMADENSCDQQQMVHSGTGLTKQN